MSSGWHAEALQQQLSLLGASHILQLVGAYWGIGLAIQQLMRTGQSAARTRAGAWWGFDLLTT